MTPNEHSKSSAATQPHITSLHGCPGESAGFMKEAGLALPFSPTSASREGVYSGAGEQDWPLRTGLFPVAGKSTPTGNGVAPEPSHGSGGDAPDVPSSVQSKAEVAGLRRTLEKSKVI